MTCRPRADLSAAASVSDNTPRSSPRSASRQPASSTQTKGKRSQALRAGISSLHPHACMYTQNCAGAGTLLYRNITSHVPPAASARTTEARSANRWSRRRSASRHRTPAGRGRQARLAWQASPIQSPIRSRVPVVSRLAQAGSEDFSQSLFHRPTQHTNSVRYSRIREVCTASKRPVCRGGVLESESDESCPRAQPPCSRTCASSTAPAGTASATRAEAWALTTVRMRACRAAGPPKTPQLWTAAEN
jgi:hypothetical protein